MKPAPDMEQEDSRDFFWTQTLSLFSSRIKDTEQGISLLLPSQKLRDGYVGSFNELFPAGRTPP